MLSTANEIFQILIMGRVTHYKVFKFWGTSQIWKPNNALPYTMLLAFDAKFHFWRSSSVRFCFIRTIARIEEMIVNTPQLTISGCWCCDIFVLINQLAIRSLAPPLCVFSRQQIFTNDNFVLSRRFSGNNGNFVKYFGKNAPVKFYVMFIMQPENLSLYPELRSLSLQKN